MISIPTDIRQKAPSDTGCRAAVMQVLLHELYKAIDDTHLDKGWGSRIRNLLEVRREAQAIEREIYAAARRLPTRKSGQ